MDIAVDRREDGTVLAIAGRMDALTAPELEKVVHGLVDDGVTTVVADLSGLQYISSAGLRSILASAKALRAGGGKLGFCGLDGMVREVFQVAGLENMFTVAATAGETFAAL